LVGSTKVAINEPNTNVTLGILDTELRIRYLEIPATLKLRTGEIGTGSLGYFTYFGQIGANIGVPISARYDLVSTVPGTESIPDEKANKLINEVGVSLVLSAGAEYNLAQNTNLFLALWWNSGFTGTIKDVEGITSNDDKVTASYFGIRVGLMF